MRRAAAFALLLLFAFTVGCGKRKGNPSAPTHFHRVVSLSPSTTEAMFAIGAGDTLVGRSRYCDFPAEAAKLPQVGGYVDPNLEAILGLAPDLVIGARGPLGTQVTDALDQRGIRWFFPKTESFDEIRTMLRALGEQTGHKDSAEQLVTQIDQSLRTTHDLIAQRVHPRVLLVFGLEPIVVAGPTGFTNELLTAGGAVNAVSAGDAYPTLGMEKVLALDPDVVLNAVMSEAHAATRIATGAPGWGELRAVKEGRVRYLTDESILRPGPRVAEAARTIAHSLFDDIPAK